MEDLRFRPKNVSVKNKILKKSSKFLAKKKEKFENGRSKKNARETHAQFFFCL